jgi:AcrR family transcriptional regulator
MVIPAEDPNLDQNAPPDDAEPASRWAELTPEAKRERLLAAAADVFATTGLGASMPAVAAAAGSGVASIYRQFPSKRELLAALVTRRLDQITEEVALAQAAEGDRWSALVAMLWKIVERQAYDDFLGEARVHVAGHADVEEATERATKAVDELMAGARAEGRLRDDATNLDLRLLFAATRASKQVEPDGWRRTLELFIDALRVD